jgi:hypothetical protein
MLHLLSAQLGSSTELQLRVDLASCDSAPGCRWPPSEAMSGLLCAAGMSSSGSGRTERRSSTEAGYLGAAFRTKEVGGSGGLTDSSYSKCLS